MIKDIKVNDYNSFILLENGDLWGCGGNFNGVLGLGHEKQINAFVKICEDVEKIKCYSYATFLFKKDKSLWFAGNGSYLDKAKDITSFIKIADDTKDVLYLELLGERKNLFCLKNNGELLNLVEHKIYLSSIEKIIRGYKGKVPCLFIISKDGSLFCFEKDIFNRVKSLDKIKNVFSCYGSSIFVQRTDNSLWEIKDYDFDKSIKIFDNVKDVVAVENKIFFLKENKDLFVLGDNYYGNLGVNQKEVNIPTLVDRNVKEIYLNFFFTLILKEDNSLWGCGENYGFILGNEPENYKFYSFKKISDNVKKVYIGGYSFFVVKHNNELWCSGEAAKYFYGNDYLKFAFNDVKNVFSDFDSFFILKKNDTLLCFGDNKYGQLGIDSKKELVKKPTEYTAIKNYYNTKETVNVIKDVFVGGKSL